MALSKVEAEEKHGEYGVNDEWVLESRLSHSSGKDGHFPCTLVHPRAPVHSKTETSMKDNFRS